MTEPFTCSLCACTESIDCFPAYDFDQSIEMFALVRCSSCGLALTTPFPELSAMDSYYSEAYYGSGSKKFAGVIESLTVLGCKLRAKNILKRIGTLRSGNPKPKVLDVGCGRANLLPTLKTWGANAMVLSAQSFL